MTAADSAVWTIQQLDESNPLAQSIAEDAASVHALLETLEATDAYQAIRKDYLK